MTDIPDIELGIRRWDVESYAVELRVSRPKQPVEVHASGRMRYDNSRLLTESLDNDAYGRRLGAYLFQDRELYRRFREALSAANFEELPLRVRLLIDTSAPELHSLRWELLCDPDDGWPLFTGERVFFSRYLSSGDWQRVNVRPKSGLRALALISSPSNLAGFGLESFDVAAEVAQLDAALGSIPLHVLASGAAQARPTLDALSAHLRDDYDILCFICHGTMHDGVAHLWLEDERGGGRPSVER